MNASNPTRAETLAIRILSVTAVFLLAAVLFVPSPLPAQEVVKEGDYQVATYPTAQAADALYVADARGDLMVVFLWDNSTRSLQPAAMRKLSDGFIRR